MIVKKDWNLDQIEDTNEKFLGVWISGQFNYGNFRSFINFE